MKRKITNTTELAQNDPLLVLMQMLGNNPIERQEAQGQIEAVESEQLPTKGLHKYLPEAEYGYLGFKIGKQVEGDDMWTNVELPLGWNKQATSHSMHNDVLDEQGRKRASFFYKAAFYDREAIMYSPNTRYRITCGPNDLYTEGDEYVETVFVDTALATYDSTGTVNKESIIHTIGSKVEKGEKRYTVSDRIGEEMNEWAKKNFPLYKDPKAYWD